MTISNAWLRQQGITGSNNELKELAALIEDTLELRAGFAIAEKLSDARLTEFEALMAEESTNEDARVAWLAENYPEYGSVVDHEIALLKKRIAQSDDPVTYIRELGA